MVSNHSVAAINSYRPDIMGNLSKDSIIKIVAFMPLHYGKTYLAAAIQSILPSIDELWIAYTPVGSHGSRVDNPCPDSRDELFAIAAEAGGDKLRWREGVWTHEGQQRNMIYEWSPDADIVLSIDSDEIWPVNLGGMVIGQILSSRSREYRLPMVHFYRDFRHGILNDMACPTRAVCTWEKRRHMPEVTLSDVPPIAHMGYAIPPALMRYKISIHGHKGEMRWSPEDYTEQVYLNENRWDDVHPTNVNYWKVVQVAPEVYLPKWMTEHPLWNGSPIHE